MKIRIPKNDKTGTELAKELKRLARYRKDNMSIDEADESKQPLTSLSARRVALNEMKQLVEKAEDKSRETVKALKSQRDNPSVTSAYYTAVGEAQAFRAVLDMLNGSTVQMNIFTR